LLFVFLIVLPAAWSIGKAINSDQAQALYPPAANDAAESPQTTPSSGAPSREEVMETCKSIASFAEAAIQGHHRGTPLSSVLELTESELLSEIAMDAYSGPRYSTPEVQSRAQSQFRDKYYLECMRASR